MSVLCWTHGIASGGRLADLAALHSFVAVSALVYTLAGPGALTAADAGAAGLYAVWRHGAARPRDHRRAPGPERGPAPGDAGGGPGSPGPPPAGDRAAAASSAA